MTCNVPRVSIAACGWMPPSGAARCSTRGVRAGGARDATSTATASARSLRGMIRLIVARCGRMPPMSASISRRHLLTTLGGAICAGAALKGQAQQGAPTVVSNPPRDFGPNAPPTTYFAGPDVITVDPSFGGLIQGNTTIRRIWTGALWVEGPAWNGQGRYLLWSDI